MTDAPQNVYSRLALARQEFTAKADFKKVKSDGLKFAYLPIEAAKPVIEECTSKYGITIIPMEYELIPDWTYSYDKASKYDGTKTKWLYQTADVVFRIAGPEDFFDITIRAEAQDNSDKCVNKVYTMAYKNLVKIMFGFAESQKDDGDATQEEIPADAPRRAKVQTADPFFSKRTEADVQTARSGKPTMKQANDMRIAIEIWMDEDPMVNASNEIIAHYAEEYGQMDTWSVANWQRVYKDLKAAGVPLKEVAGI